jgi:ABC-type uncharacterized transport system substrate-binding protein
MLRLIVSTFMLLTAGVPSALAHPHVWVDAAAEVVFDESGRSPRSARLAL